LRALFACGGTGGHIYPAIAIAEALAAKYGAKVFFAGSDYGMEKGIIESRKFSFYAVHARPFVRKFTAENIINAFLVVRAFFESAKLVRELAPDIVIGTGGFVSFPVVLAAAFAGKKTLIHEPNTSPGIANRVLGMFASAVTTGFPETVKAFKAGKTHVTGNPVRETIIKSSRKKAYKEFGLVPGKNTVLVMPGSRAARKINDIMIESLDAIGKDLKDTRFLWMTGNEDYGRVKKAVEKSRVKAKALRYIDDAGAAYAASDAALLRAGASTLSEVAACGAAAILVPYPHATGNHQEKNAEAFAARGAAIVIKDRELTEESLVRALQYALDPKNNRGLRRQAKKLYRGKSAELIAAIAAGETR
jgi:UDP-N-acetylglucosamine--N-acetylmuramyl-(pentapeptide) pyrophosphoryl-undecaprenol N-acetylglucosamine transferase